MCIGDSQCRQKKNPPPTTWIEFIGSIGLERLRKFPLVKQTQSDCFAVANKLAIWVQTGTLHKNSTKRYESCDGGEIIHAAREMGGKFFDVHQEFGLSKVVDRVQFKEDVLVALVSKLSKGNVLVLDIQNCGSPHWNKEYQQFMFCMDSEEAHAVCVIGSYTDARLGPCFVTKASNPVAPHGIRSAIQNKITIEGQTLSSNHYAYALLPFSWLKTIDGDIGQTRVRSLAYVLAYPIWKQ